MEFSRVAIVITSECTAATMTDKVKLAKAAINIKEGLVGMRKATANTFTIIARDNIKAAVKKRIDSTMGNIAATVAVNILAACLQTFDQDAMGFMMAAKVKILLIARVAIYSRWHWLLEECP